MFSPPVTPENYPILFNFLNQPHSQDDVDVLEANQHDVAQPPPEPPDDERTRRFPRVDYQALHEHGGQEGGFQGGWRGRRDRERRGAPEY